MRIISSLMVPGCLAVMLTSCESTGNRIESSRVARQSEPASLPPAEPKPLFEQTGEMSYYSVKTNGGRQTASGEKFSDDSATAAHRSLPFGTMVKVTNLANNRSEIVRINNRGPYKKGRILDVSISTAKKLNFINSGVVSCQIEVYEDQNKPELLTRVANLSPQVPGSITAAIIRPLAPPSLMEEESSMTQEVELTHLADAPNTPEATTASPLIGDGAF